MGRPRQWLAGLILALVAASASAQSRTITPQATKAPAGSTLYADSWAVVIGINDYQHPRVPALRYAVNDARSVERALRAQGFRPDRITSLLDRDATKARIETVLGDELRLKVGANDRVMVFFAGHGMTDRLRSGDEEGYLMPVDGDPSRLFGTAISMTALRQISDRLPAKHILYVVDACYSGYALFNRSIARELVDEMVKKPAIQILTAGRQGDQAQERGGHGVFTQVLIRGLEGEAFAEKGWLALEELGVWMKQRVFVESNRQQLPQFGNLSGEGQFVFLRPSAQAAAAMPPAPEPPRLDIKEETRQEFGVLAVSSRITGVEVWLDDQKVGATLQGVALVVSNVPVGSHRITGRKDDHKSWEREVQVAANQRSEVMIDIEPLRPDPPPVTDARTFRWKLLSTNLADSIFHEGALRLASAVEDLSGGRLKFDVLPQGAVVPNFGVFDAVGQGTAEASYARAQLWSGKFRWAQLYSGVPFGLTAEETTHWLERAGGLALQRDLYAPYNVIPFPAGTSGDNMAGWVKREIRRPEDLHGLKITATALSLEVLQRAGSLVTALPPWEIASVFERGLIDGAAHFGPFEDMLLGLHKIGGATYYRPAAWLPPAYAFELIVNKRMYEDLSPLLQKHIEEAARQTNRWMLAEIRQRNARALSELTSVHGVRVRELPESVLSTLRRVTEQALAEFARGDPNFARVYTSFQQARGGSRR